MVDAYSKVKSPVAVLGPLKGLNKDLVLVELSLLNCLVYVLRSAPRKKYMSKYPPPGKKKEIKISNEFGHPTPTDSHDILVHDSAGTDVQVADFGIAHQALGQTDSCGRGLKLSKALLVLGEGVHGRALGVGDGIAVLGRLLAGDSPAIDND